MTCLNGEIGNDRSTNRVRYNLSAPSSSPYSRQSILLLTWATDIEPNFAGIDKIFLAYGAGQDCILWLPSAQCLQHTFTQVLVDL